MLRLAGEAATARRPLRVVHVIDSVRYGGAERLVLTTVEHLDAARFRSEVIALFEPLDLAGEFARLGVPLHHLDLRGPLDWRRGLLGLARLLRRRRPDIVHTHLRYANFYGRLAAALVRVPSVVTSLHAVEYSDWPSRRLGFWLRKLADRLVGRLISCRFIAVSRAVRDDYAKHLGFRNIDVIHNYLDPADFAPLAPATLAAARRAFGWAGEDFVVANVGRLAWEKGQRHLLLAMGEVRQSVPGARLLLVGDGPDEDALRATTRTLGLEDAVAFMRKRSDVSTLLALADVFVFPSLSEGLGIALLEAMAAGRAVVASRAGGIEEVIEDGVDGLLAAPGDAGAIAAAVLRLHRDPALRQALGTRAQATVERRFSLPAGISRVEALYETLARRAR